MAITSAIATTFKKELAQGGHNFDLSGGDTFKFGLFKATADVIGTYGAATALYATIVAGPDELATAGGYTTGGVTLTRIDPATSGTIAFLDFADFSISAATFVTSGGFIYNSTTTVAVDPIVAVFDFAGDQTVTAGTFTIQFPVADSTTAIIRIT